ncbi:YqaJ viral recombinase family protein, partial [Alcanivorax sp. HI0044]|uniref:YqaJ viral recombinase family protein n=1 Tax=Alcanivorax sp. HI0044 TaxID=1822234 RepID=UPI000AC6CB70
MAQPKSTTPTQRPALRLVSTKQMSREDWLKIRKQGIGASDAAAAVGISPYQSPLELWMIKTGRDGLFPAPDPDDIQSPLSWGTLLEPQVAEAYAKITG